MGAEITVLSEARLIRAARSRSPALASAERYLAFAEQAIALVATVDDIRKRQAICRISEAWLALAEAELRRD